MVDGRLFQMTYKEQQRKKGGKEGWHTETLAKKSREKEVSEKRPWR